MNRNYWPTIKLGTRISAVLLCFLVAFGFFQQDVGVLTNPSFEDGWTRDTLYWTPEGGPYTNPFGEIFAPEGWTVWWMQDFPCATGYTFNEGRPEVQVIGAIPDPGRIHSGDKATKAFTFWRCHD